MKKLYTLLFMALVAIGANAQIARIGTPVDFNAAPKHVPTQKIVRVQNFSPTANTQMQLKKMAAPKKAITSVDQLVGNYLTISDRYTVDNGSLVENEDFPIYCPAVTITKIDDTTIGLDGFTTDATKTIQATVNLTDGTFSIADGQVLLEDSDYGPIVLANASEEGAPLTGTISDDGIYFDNSFVWCSMISTGQYAGYTWDGYFAETFFIIPNGSMEYKNTTYSYAGPADVFITVNDEEYYAVVYNFAGEGCPVIIMLEDDNKFTVPDIPCIEGSETTGDFYVVGIKNNSIIDLTGKGTDKKLTFGSDWTFFTDNSYWYGQYTSSSISITSGTTKFVYPIIPNVEAIPADPTVYRYNAYEEVKDGKYGMLIFEIPSVDAEDNPIKKSKLYYKVFTRTGTTENPFVLKKQAYPEITGIQMTEIPYELTGDNIVSSGDLRGLLMNIDLSTYDAVGVQSVYKGGGTTNETDIIWYDLNSSGITPVTKAERNDGVIYSIDGRRLNEAPAKGIYIQNGKKYLNK